MEKQYQFKEAESALQTFWDDNNVYALGENDLNKVLFSIDTPPPTVSGSLHIGHVFSYTQTDIIARYKRMSGYKVFYPFGFDDNGLPTERYVEKKRGIKGSAMDRSAFIAVCIEESQEAAKQFTALWKKLGISAYWKKTYSTISPEVRKISQQLFLDLLEQNVVYRSHEIALYCTACQTSVSQAELDDSEHASTFNDIIFFDAQNNPLTIGTTRPELLPSCVALFFNPDDARYTHLAGTHATVPLYDYTVPIIADKRVAIDKGTGLVMCCTFGDKTDIEWHEQYALPYKPSFDRRGKWLATTGQLAGLGALEARKKVLLLLNEQGLLAGQKPIRHAVNTHERCQTAIEYLMLPQWFVRIVDQKAALIKKSDDIQWFPEYMKSRYTDWVEHIGWDWCISRQRFYGVPFPVWHCTHCQAYITPSREQLPIDPQENVYTKPCPQCGNTAVIPDTDVMDTWNTSSVTPYICQSLYQEIMENSHDTIIPMSMRPQAHDIIRTWAFDTIVKSHYLSGTIPWHSIVISGHVLSGAHEKISKSKENSAMNPLSLLENYPADAIRYWTSSAALGTDVSFSESQIKIGLRLVTKLWNAFRFIADQTHGVSFEQEKPTHEQLGIINQWLFHELYETSNKYHEYFKNFECSLALQKIERFFWTHFCDNYLELIKHQLFNKHLYSPEAVYATQWTLYHVGYSVLQMYAPFVPHITEHLYQDMYMVGKGVPSIHQSIYVPYITQCESSAHDCQVLLALAATIRKLKTEHKLSLKTPLQSITVISADQRIITIIQSQETLMCGVTQAATMMYKKSDIAVSAGSSFLQSDESNQWHATVYYESVQE